MASEILAGLGAFKPMLDLAKGLKDVNDAATRNTVAIELQEKILAAHAEQSALIERVGELEAQVAEFETWDAEKQRYELTDFGSGTFAYVLKPSMSGSEPSHRICEACYQKGHKSILQFRHRIPTGQDKYACPACKTDFFLGEHSEPPVIRTRGPGRSWTDR